MLKLKIITDKPFCMNEVESISLLKTLGSREIDYAYSDPGEDNVEYNYFEIQINGMKKILAVSGTVEQWEIPETEQKIKTYDKLGG